MAKKREALRRERKKWEQASAECRYERDQAEAREHAKTRDGTDDPPFAASCPAPP